MEVSSVCACTRLRLIARKVTEQYEAALAPTGLTSPQFTLLVALELRGPVSLSDLARHFDTDRTTLYRNAKPLLKQKLIGEAPEPNGRTKAFELTERGRTVLIKALPLWRKAQRSLLDRVGQQHWQQMAPRLQALLSP